MPRPVKCRRISCSPKALYFKPQGVPLAELEEVSLTLDETEALRLAHLEGLYQEASAEKMKVSRQTFGNILNAAHKKISEAIIHGKALRIEGGVYTAEYRIFGCDDCNNEWDEPFGTGRPEKCAACGSANIYRAGTVTPAGRKKQRCRYGQKGKEEKGGKEEKR